jgi:N-acetylmuramoyl-L-alanine amidase
MIVGLLAWSCVVLTPAGFPYQSAWASAAAGQDKIHARHKKARIKATPASLLPATIHNVRVMTTPDKIRLVLDLDRPTTVVERRADNPSRVVIALPHAAMSRSAKTKAADGTVPSPFVVTQTAAPAVALSLPTTAFRTYKHFTLTDPPRLVVDVTPGIDTAPAALDVPQAPSLPSGPLVQPAAPPAKGYKTIVIDPGHGGKDPGARGLRHTEEKDITLKVALKLRELLSKQPGIRVLMTRDHDVFVELEDRAKFANSNEADLFVSIHVNSHPSRHVKGIEIYHFGEAKDQRALEVAARENGTPLSSTGVGWEYLVADLLTTKKIEASLELAWTAKEAMVAHMNGHYAMNDHGVKTAPFYVLRFTSMPSILAEIAYISNPAEEDLLRKPAFVRDVAASLYQGVNAYLVNNKSTIR